MSVVIARAAEKQQLDDALRSPNAELIAVYGRRRVGKTFLIRQHYAAAICFELVGIHDASLAVQLRSFAHTLATAVGRGRASAPPPVDWHAAFRQLTDWLQTCKPKRGKRVVFFDELPWLASRRSGFLPAFEHFWNAWAAQQPWLVVVVCGSAASWMLEKVVRQRGGLHNRVTRRLRVEPFSLADARTLLASRGVDLGNYQTAELYMALGGIPFYLAAVRGSESAAQNIDRLCFAADGLLRHEYTTLYASLFEQADRHEAVVQALARKPGGMTRSELLGEVELGSGGAATKVLDELEEAGFLLQMPRLGRIKRDSVYWLADEYSRFYLTWIARHRGASKGTWMRTQGTPRWRAWAGLAFEALCLKHSGAIKAALGIAGVATVEASWACRANARSGSSDLVDEGAQIDLVIDRADRTTNLCELKFTEAEFVVDKKYAAVLKHKRDAFRAVTGSKKALLVTLVTTYGVRANEHARGIVQQAITLDALFG